MRILRLLLFVVLFVCGLAAETALERYVAAPDPAYRYKVADSFPNIGYTTHVLDMTSQTWLTKAEVNRPEWRHWITVVIPAKVSSSTALLFIGGGSNGGSAPLAADKRLVEIARATNAVVGELAMIPNQPITFAGESNGRKEDSLIAYGWDKYLRGGDAKWLARLPMTKAAVRAMDAVTEFAASDATGGHTVDKYVVAGGSKRGWTTWTTAAVDKRVVAIIPLVIDLLNLEPSMIHHYRAYGFWAPAIDDYERMGIMKWLGKPEFRAMLKEVDPYSYRERLTMPKFLVNSSGDQFFLPDSSQFYFDDLAGEKYLHYIPNTDHSLDHRDTLESIVTYFWSVIHNKPRPEFSWTFPDEGGIVVTAESKPAEVKLWYATNSRARDFRREKIGAAWKSVKVEETDGAYVAQPARPAAGWTAYFLELTFPSGGRFPYKFTTPVRVTPERLPHSAPTADAASDAPTASAGRTS